ncbi:hypothetical protein Fmac_022568 [Flemingia macrophylla]|uniref:Uncharacterized protein n=1 Tax=Flemingia macrophylla TaxID=520843 RepID=A0ABD1M030_9FABA
MTEDFLGNRRFVWGHRGLLLRSRRAGGCETSFSFLHQAFLSFLSPLRMNSLVWLESHQRKIALGIPDSFFFKL